MELSLHNTNTLLFIWWLATLLVDTSEDGGSDEDGAGIYRICWILDGAIRGKV